METLVFQLQAPLSSWGEVAVGEYRPSAEYPGQSAIQGLLAAALGIDRLDVEGQAAIQQGYRLVVGVLSSGKLMRDYHTAQVPGRADLKKRPQATRKDELSVPKNDLNTILSSRDYRQDASSLVAVQAVGQSPYSLQQLAAALQKPKFVLYLGRKSCPIAVPLSPLVVIAATVKDAFEDYQRQLTDRWQQHVPRSKPLTPAPLQKMAWSDEFGSDDLALLGVSSRHLSIVRKDRVITRQGWQFTDRNEHIALLAEG